MNQKNLELSTQAISQYNSLINNLLSHRKLPDVGWDDNVIEWFINEISMMDSNNFIENIGVGEREGRLYSQIVARRHFGLAHGIGRSGDINEQQPKAAGSSLIQKLTNYLVLDALRIAGLEKSIDACLVLPMATGMTIALTLMTMRQTKPKATYVLWPRIDQKSCLKSIVTASLTPIVIENQLIDDVITTNLQTIEETIKSLGAENILCVMSTTSCFAPRIPDNELCKKYDVGHVINNAYGLQCTKITHQISQSVRLGRVDYVVQSTDKNFMVPVGGAIVASPLAENIDRLAKNYPGRASGAPILDLFITLLSMGRAGYRRLLDERKQLLPYFIDEMSKVVKEVGVGRILNTQANTISFGIAIDSNDVSKSVLAKDNISMIGSKLFMRSCSGARVIDVQSGQKKSVGNIDFKNYGSHIDNYPTSYLTVACAIGITKEDIDLFSKRLKKVLMNK
ncbi:O-phosphoseryl-tRNA selenium transferase [Heterostelium album PN500]|uniref:O-phosphoseryl-tRNA(Sec) selenium transferase n=1 Tax=Heterostelium pallidum (strain ATCC 26659 / Pp 5 / PN500) TaxID=670386 RepID=D3BK65_HETP5|nr:O-phosphoseryl-tRNA selenium transferase [Heterostelium album PN500]EFA78295.1 O-phosphoseryl-tRNA selenium transferase [Heterostelium album PN500]|eukprot:XP_020430420.1 O-phosphoseryl-tRNA selenium transferase [Heterostelium album PN500]